MPAKKSASRTTSRKAPDSVTSVSDWKKNAKSKPNAEGAPLKLPSGNTALVRRPGLKTFLTENLIPNSLIEPMMAAAQGDSKASKKASSALEEDPTKLGDLFDLIDAVTVYCVVEPAVHAVPAGGEKRKDDLLYVDEVDEEDKFFIFNVAVGGTDDIARFRAESGLGVASMGNGR